MKVKFLRTRIIDKKKYAVGVHENVDDNLMQHPYFLAYKANHDLVILEMPKKAAPAQDSPPKSEMPNTPAQAESPKVEGDEGEKSSDVKADGDQSERLSENKDESKAEKKEEPKADSAQASKPAQKVIQPNRTLNKGK